MNSNLIGCSTGKSARLVPFKAFHVPVRNEDELPRDQGLSQASEGKHLLEGANYPPMAVFGRKVFDKVVLGQP